MEGAIRLGFACEPDARAAARVQGARTQTLLAEDPAGGAPLAVALRSEDEAFLNGERRTVAYLSHLRLRDDQRHSPRLILRGFDRIRDLQRRAGSPPLFASVLSDNRAALRLLTRGARGWPRSRELGSFVTLVIPTRGRTPSGGTSLRAAERADLPGLAAFLQSAYRRFQLAPAWTHDRLSSPDRARDLRPEDFLVAADSRGRTLGCLALWDQRGFKQTVAWGYGPLLGRARPLWNALAPLTGRVRLPAPGRPLAQGYLSHLALAQPESDLQTLIDLVHAGRRAAASRGLDLVALGLSADHPLLGGLRAAVPHRKLEARLLSLGWPGDPEPDFDRRIPHVEVAVL